VQAKANSDRIREGRKAIETQLATIMQDHNKLQVQR
jgi:hypothetical protein